jgi:putative PIN family toxin of toxin-antitoxin system
VRVVLDTCILFSALRSSSGASYRIIRSLPERKFQPVVSTPVFFEYEEVLLRPGQFPHLNAEEINDFLDYFASVCEPVRINFLWRPTLPDPDDDLVLELAVSAQADAIVTYNLKDFAGTERFGVRMLSPRQFIQEIQL